MRISHQVARWAVASWNSVHQPGVSSVRARALFHDESSSNDTRVTTMLKDRNLGKGEEENDIAVEAGPRRFFCRHFFLPVDRLSLPLHAAALG